MSNENLTSAAVTGSPFEKCACGLMWNVADSPSGATRMSSANRPYCGRDFVGTTGRETLEQKVHARRRITAQRERIEFIEARLPVGISQNQRAALRRIRIDVIEVLETGRIFRFAVLRNRVGCVRRLCRQQSRAGPIENN